MDQMYSFYRIPLDSIAVLRDNGLQCLFVLEVLFCKFGSAAKISYRSKAQITDNTNR